MNTLLDQPTNHLFGRTTRMIMRRKSFLMAFLLSLFLQSQSSFALSDPLRTQSAVLHLQVERIDAENDIQLNTIHSWLIQVKNAQGSVVDNLRLYIDGGMPAHGHGLPTQPVAEALGNGQYRIKGLKFNMPGYWQVKVHMRSANVQDVATFELEL